MWTLSSTRKGGIDETPTGESIRELAKRLAAIEDDPEAPMAIVVATDGETDTCAEPNPRTVRRKRSPRPTAFAMGISPYVISVGDQASHDPRPTQAPASLPKETRISSLPSTPSSTGCAAASSHFRVRWSTATRSKARCCSTARSSRTPMGGEQVELTDAACAGHSDPLMI